MSSADYAYGELGCPPLIPKNATIVFEMEILDIEKWEEVVRVYSIVKLLMFV